MLNFLAWMVYFVQTCCLTTSSALFDKGGICEFIGKVISEGQCCVCDPDDKSDRCCSFERSYISTPAFFCCGHVGDKGRMDGKKYDAKRLSAMFKTILVVFACIFGIIGAICLISPEKVVFNVMVVDEFRQQLGIEEEKVMPIEEQIHKETVMSMLKSSMSGLTALFDNSDGISKEDLAKIRDQLGQVQSNLIYNKPETMAVTDPTALMGGAMLFYTIMCVLQMRMTLGELLNWHNVNLHVVWFGFGLFSVILATAGHGRNMERSLFVMLLILFYAIGLLAMGVVFHSFQGFFLKHGKLAKYAIDEDDDDEIWNDSDG